MNEKEELIIERLLSRVEKANTYFLEQIAKNIAKLKGLKPSDAHKLAQILKYGENYKEIVKKIAKYMNANVEDVDDILSNYAKNDANFYEKFYKYRNIPMTPFEQNKALNDQKNAISRVIKNELYSFTRPNVLGYTIRDINNRVQFYGLKETYDRVIDEALLNLTQGKETFDNSMARLMREIGGSGLEKIDYKTGRSMRLDSAVRMHVLDGMRNLHNANQEIYGEQFGANGYEISVHSNPATDHASVQGRQFSSVKPNDKELSEWEKLQKGQEAKDYKGNTYSLDHDENGSYRPISTMNCYHYIYSIILGVNKPQYTDEQLKQIENESKKKIEIDGKEYTKYECSQLQRQLERRIREQKDIQIMGRASDNKELIGKSQQKITELTKKYKEVSDLSGLPTKNNRLKVAGYRRVKVDIEKKPIVKEPKKPINIQPKTIEDDYTFHISKDYQIEKNNIKIENIKAEIKKGNNDMKMYYDSAKRRGNNPEKDGDYSSTHYRLLKGDVKKKKDMLEELKNKEFEDKTIVLKDYDSCKELLDTSNIHLDESMKTLDNKLLIENTAQLYRLNNKYPIVANEISKKRLNVTTLSRSVKGTYAQTTGVTLEYNKYYFQNREFLKQRHSYDESIKWHYSVGEENATIYTTTHEYGHILQKRFNDAYNKNHTIKDWKSFDNMTMEAIYDKAKRETKLKITDLKDQYLTDYGKSKRNYEAFAEIFAGMELGVDNPLTRAMKEYLEEMKEWM